MSKVQLATTPEVRAQILQLIALEKLENDKSYTIKSYLEMLVGLAARGKFGEAGNPKVEVNYEPVELRVAAQGNEFWRNDKVVRLEESFLRYDSPYQEAVALCNSGQTLGLSLDPAFAAWVIKHYNFEQPVCGASSAERVYIDYTTGVVITYETDGRISIKKHE